MSCSLDTHFPAQSVSLYSHRPPQQIFNCLAQTRPLYLAVLLSVARYLVRYAGALSHATSVIVLRGNRALTVQREVHELPAVGRVDSGLLGRPAGVMLGQEAVPHSVCGGLEALALVLVHVSLGVQDGNHVHHLTCSRKWNVTQSLRLAEESIQDLSISTACLVRPGSMADPLRPGVLDGHHACHHSCRG